MLHYQPILSHLQVNLIAIICINRSNDIEQNRNWRWNLCFRALKEETPPDVSACRCRHLPNNAAILSPSTPRVISLTSSISPYQGSTLSPLTSNLWDPSLTLPGQDGIPVHDTLGNLINKRFLFFVVCCLFCLFFSFRLDRFTFYPLVSLPVSLTPQSFSLFWVICVVCTVKRPYQVPRYVWDAAPHVPTFRFGKEMPSTNRLQGSSTSHAPPLSARTVFPLAYSSANLCALAVFPLVFWLFFYFYFYFLLFFVSPHALIFLV